MIVMITLLFASFALVAFIERAANDLLVVFIAVVYPYIATSKRVFGSYFFNVNTAYYIWYDTGAQARALLLPHTDTRGVIAVPVEQLPTMASYLATHSLGQSPLLTGGWDALSSEHLEHHIIRRVVFIEKLHHPRRVRVRWIDQWVRAFLENVDDASSSLRLLSPTFLLLFLGSSDS